MAESFYSQQATPGAAGAAQPAAGYGGAVAATAAGINSTIAAPQINMDAINGTLAQTQVCATSLLYMAVDT